MLTATKYFASPHETSCEEEVEAARVLYCELLDGLEIVSATPADAEKSVCFVVDDVLIETGHGCRGQMARVPVEDPERLAARCWNAGYTVVVGDAAGASRSAAISVLDPFGLRIELTSRE